MQAGRCRRSWPKEWSRGRLLQSCGTNQVEASALSDKCPGLDVRKWVLGPVPSVPCELCDVGAGI